MGLRGIAIFSTAGELPTTGTICLPDTRPFLGCIDKDEDGSCRKLSGKSDIVGCVTGTCGCVAVASSLPRLNPWQLAVVLRTHVHYLRPFNDHLIIESRGDKVGYPPHMGEKDKKFPPPRISQSISFKMPTELEEVSKPASAPCKLNLTLCSL